MPKFRRTHTPVGTIARVSQYIVGGLKNRVNVVRDNMLDGGRLSFKPTAPLNMISVGEGGQDTGGPSREFLRLAMLGLQDMHNSGMNVNDILQKWAFCSEISTTYKSFSQVNHH